MTHSRPILVSGATGLIGGRLVPALLDAGFPVRALSRRANPRALDARARTYVWNGRDVPHEATAGIASVVHLAGEPVFGGLPSAARRHRIRSSRIESTRGVARALRALPAEARPTSFVCASAIGYYGTRGDALLEENAAPGDGFLAEVCRAWEAEAREVEALGVRVVCLRTGIVLAREGGALPLMALPFRCFVGGRMGNGRQWVPWIHIDDLVALARIAIDDERYRGPLNAVAPEPVTNTQFTRALCRVLGRPSLIPVPAFALRLALRELSVELLGSRRVVPALALASGFTFRYPEIDAALSKELG